MPDALICYCGYYGGSCAIWCGYPHFRETVRLLAEWVDSMGFQHWMPEVVKDFDYKEFRKGMEFLSKEEGGLRCTKCCKGGEGNPYCEVRICCKERGLEICFDCADLMGCEKIQKFPNIIERCREYKALGREEWLRKQEEQANQGYEFHTGKYYKIQAEKK
ncbi:DUF3795 domain-containing protein [bacterium]|nr:DUF3795 domain-containing protein [bacterium]